MKNIYLTRVSKSILVAVALMTPMISCQKERECNIIKNNSYKGYGFFYFVNHFQDLRTELCFIPVCAEKEDLLHFRNLNPQTGIDVYCYIDDSFLRTIVMHSKMISGQGGFDHYLTPVYIEFEEAPDYRERLKKSDANQIYLKWPIPLTGGDTLMVKYFFSCAELGYIIKINRIDFFYFVEE